MSSTEDAQSNLMRQHCIIAFLLLILARERPFLSRERMSVRFKILLGANTITGTDLLGSSYDGTYTIENMRLKISGTMTALKQVSIPGAAPIAAGTIHPFMAD